MLVPALLLVCTTFSGLFGTVYCHGRLIDPPSRSSMWRYGFGTPRNYNDNELFCGGIGVQWQRNGGKCGVCGDPYNDPQPRDNEAGGKYAKGIIVRSYQAGQVIKATVDLTANHLGYFEFHICPHNSPKTIVTQECLDQNPLELANQDGSRYYIRPAHLGNIDVFLVLPQNMSCTQCVLQWQYIGGNNWGRCKNHTQGLGCGPQEMFRACSDVSITNDHQPTSFPLHQVSTEVPKARTDQTKISRTATETAAESIFPTSLHPEVPSTVKIKDDDEKECGVHPSKANYLPGLDYWCKVNCLMGNCPKNLCLCK